VLSAELLCRHAVVGYYLSMLTKFNQREKPQRNDKPFKMTSAKPTVRRSTFSSESPGSTVASGSSKSSATSAARRLVKFLKSQGSKKRNTTIETKARGQRIHGSCSHQQKTSDLTRNKTTESSPSRLPPSPEIGTFANANHFFICPSRPLVGLANFPF